MEKRLGSRHSPGAGKLEVDTSAVVHKGKKDVLIVVRNQEGVSLSRKSIRLLLFLPIRFLSAKY